MAVSIDARRWPESAPSLEQAVARAIHAGGLIAYPTETLYGLGVGVASAAAVARLFAIKQRDAAQPLPFIASSLEAVRSMAVLDDRAAAVAARAWPGPLTLVLPALGTLLPELVSQQGTVAVRVSSHPVALAVARAAGGVVTSTSANRSGAPAASTLAMMREALGDAFGHDDVLVDGGTTPGGPPSTIVDLSTPEPRLLRAGAVAWDRVLEFLR